MGIAIFFRNTLCQNYFRNIILDLLSDERLVYLMMTYPYFYQNKPYHVTKKGEESKDTGTTNEAEYGILDDGIKTALLSRQAALELKTISANRDKDWEISYRSFVDDLRIFIENERRPILYYPYITCQKYNVLHAKFSIGCVRDSKGELVPVVIVLGSSNMTDSAFGSNGNFFGNFNYESDVLIWSDMYQPRILYNGNEGLKPIIVKDKVENEQEWIDYFWKSAQYTYSNILNKV